MTGGLGNIGAAHVTVELDFVRAIQEARSAFNSDLARALDAAGKEGAAAFASSLEPGVADAGAAAGKEAGIELGATAAKGAAAAGKESARLFSAELVSSVVKGSAVAGKEGGAAFSTSFGASVRVAAAGASARFSETFAAASVRASSIAGRLSGAAFAARFRETVLVGTAAVGSAVRAALLPAAIAVGIIGVELKKGADSAKAYSQAMTEVNQATKLFGKATGVTTKQISDVAGGFKDLTSITGTSIKTSEASLLKFGIVSKKNLKPMTALLLDAAVGMRQVSDDGKIAAGFATKFGRAIQDPVKGLSLLGRAGVPVTASQKQLVKDLVKSGKTAQAQAVILDLLRTKFKGAAAQFGTSIGGQLRKASFSFEEARRNLTLEILPKIVPVIAMMGKQIADVLDKNQKPIAQFINGFIRGAGAILKFVTTSKPFHQILAGIASVIAGIATGLKGFALAFGKAFSGKGGKNAQTFGETMQKLGKTVGTLAAKWLPKLGTALGKFAAFIAESSTRSKAFFGFLAAVKLGALGPILSAIIGILRIFGSVVLTVLVPVIKSLPIILRIVVTAFEAVGLAVSATIAVFVAIAAIFVILTVKVRVFRNGLKVLGKIMLIVFLAPIITLRLLWMATVRAFQIIRTAVSTAIAWIRARFADWRAGINVLRDRLSAFATHVAGVFARIRQIVSDWLASVRARLATARGLFAKFVDRVRGILSGFSLFNLGERMMTGLLDGIKAGFEKVKSFVSKIAGIIKSLKGPISVDRKLLVHEGGAIMQGFEKGLRNRFGPIKKWIHSIGGIVKAAVHPGEMKQKLWDLFLGHGKIGNLNKLMAPSLGFDISNIAAGVAGLHPTSGWLDTLAQGNLLSKIFNVGITSGLRQIDTVPGPAVSQHVLGQAIDFGTSKGSDANLTALATFTSRLVSAIFKQVIWKNSLWQGGTPGHGFVADHMDHVHLGWQPRAAGGAVQKGRHYSWNERGREMFMPNQNGYIMNASRTKDLVSAIKSIAQKGSSSTDNRQQTIIVKTGTDGRGVVPILEAVFSRA